MKYDFTSILERKGHDALAVDNVGKKIWRTEPTNPKDNFSFIPMWVADMNFATCPAVIQSIQDRLQYPTFGYFNEPEKYYESIIQWQENHHHTRGLTPEMIGYENGVHGCVTTVVSVLSQPNDAIFLHRPFYSGFNGDVTKYGRKAVFSDLKKDEQGIYRMDFEDMEKVISQNNVHLAIFCSPHNPTGRVWERWELEKAMAIFEKYHVYVISDEIWADLTYTGHQHIPTTMVNDWAREHTVSIYAPSKTFNLSGMVGSYHIIFNKYLRDCISKYASQTHYNTQNVLSMHALMGAYSKDGYEWVEELKSVLENNCRYTVDFFKNEVDGVEATMPQGTYMIFIDCAKYLEKTGMTLDELLQAGWDVGVGWQSGRGFGGLTHIRMNLASPFSMIQEACNRLKKYVFIDE